jgi:hypothetical protein
VLAVTKIRVERQTRRRAVMWLPLEPDGMRIIIFDGEPCILWPRMWPQPVLVIKEVFDFVGSRPDANQRPTV